MITSPVSISSSSGNSIFISPGQLFPQFSTPVVQEEMSLPQVAGVDSWPMPGLSEYFRGLSGHSIPAVGTWHNENHELQFWAFGQNCPVEWTPLLRAASNHGAAGSHIPSQESDGLRMRPRQSGEQSGETEQWNQVSAAWLSPWIQSCFNLQSH